MPAMSYEPNPARMNRLSKKVWFPFGLLLLSSSWGCGAMTLSSQPLSAPFFSPTQEDTARLATFTRELDTMAARCVSPLACDQVHFSRALVALFESREAARTSFRRVISANPSSPLAASSTSWLQLIGEGGVQFVSNNEQQSALIDITAQLIRDWMDRQLAEHRNEGKSTLSNKRDPPAEEPGIVQGLQKQVRERDRRIAELTSQLDALKMIDHDHEERRKSSRTPATLTPSGTDNRR